MAAKLNWFGDRAKAAIRQSLDARMDQAGKAIVARARELAPVETGKLRDSISYMYSTSTMTLTIHADMPYSGFVEFGTTRMSARPYLRPALAAASDLFFTTSTAAVMDFSETDAKYAAGMQAQHGGPHNFGSTARFGRR